MKTEIIDTADSKASKTQIFFTPEHDGYWEVEIYAEKHWERTWYTVRHNGWVEFEACASPATGVHCTRGKKAQLPDFVKARLVGVLS